MKTSISWLQKSFDAPLPHVDALVDSFTFHAFEIEEAAGDLMDVKVLPNRAADCLCHRGIAKELAAILELPMKRDPLREPVPSFPPSTLLKVEVEDSQKCLRYMGAFVRGVKVGSSPAWLKEALESVGQRSINNIVDATNFVMLDVGQPLHAFDANLLEQKNIKDGPRWNIAVQTAREGEKMLALDEKEYALDPSILTIVDAHADKIIGIAGIKGGTAAQISGTTCDVIIESANFNGPLVRRAAQKLKLFTDASLRFQNNPSPELCAYGMRDVLELVVRIAGGEIEGVVDVYPTAPKQVPVQTSLARINGLLGSQFAHEEVAHVFTRLDLHTKIEGDTFTITPPFERTDIVIPEDLTEEVGRILGYDRVAPLVLPPTNIFPDQARYRGVEFVKDFLVDRGFTEISTQTFSKKGDIVLANPLDKTNPALRTDLAHNMQEALTKAAYYAPLVLSSNQKSKLFEIGTVFTNKGEHTVVETSEPVKDLPALQDRQDYTPRLYELGAFKPFSAYPYIVRDIALWTPSGTNADKVLEMIQKKAGALCVKIYLFDTFTKEGRVSLAFRLIFQSFERTLTEEEVNKSMAELSGILGAKGFEIR
jgi:phenylalanyl-tRNA synthetase beta chain